MTTWFHEINKTLKMAGPIMLGFLGQQLFGMVDTMMVGRHSTVELAAAAFVNSVCNIPLVFIFGFSSCISVLVSQDRGQNGGASSGRFLRHGVILLVGWAALIVIGLELLNLDLNFFGQPPEVVAASHAFLSLMTLSLFPLGVFMAFRQFSDGLEHTSPPAVITAVGFLVNTVLCWLLIFGNWGCPELGLTGAGIATLTARMVMMILMIAHVLRGPFYRKFLGGFHVDGWKKFFSLDFSIVKRCSNLGYPAGAQYLFEVGIFAGSAILMGWLGTVPLAAHQIAINCASVAFMLPLSLSNAASIRIGGATGSGDWGLVRRIGWSTAFAALIATAVTAVFFAVARNEIPHWFTKDTAVIQLASEIFVLAAIFQLFDGFQAVLVGNLRGISDVKVPTILLFFAYWVIGASSSYGLAFVAGYRHIGVWSGLAISLIAASLFLGVRFHRLMTLKNRAPNVAIPGA